MTSAPTLPNTPNQALRELEYWQAAFHLAELKFEVARRLLEQAQANLDLVKSVARGDFEEDVPAEPGRLCDVGSSRACGRLTRTVGVDGMNRTLTEKLWSQVRKDLEGCWVWEGVRSDGYGVLYDSDTKRQERTHRLSYALAYGPIPVGLYVLHRCDNPPCVRPDHLFLGTHLDNIADMVAKGRVARGERNAWAQLTEAAVVYIRTSRDSGVPAAVLAAEIGVSERTIRKVDVGLRWAHVGPPRQHRVARVLTAEIVAEIRRRHAAGGVTQKALAAEFGVGRGAVQHVIAGDRWAPRGPWCLGDQR